MPQNECPISARIMTVQGEPLQPFAGPQSTQSPQSHPRAGWHLPRGPFRRPEVTLGQPEGPLEFFQEFAMLPLEKNSGPPGRPHFTLSESVPARSPRVHVDLKDLRVLKGPEKFRVSQCCPGQKNQAPRKRPFWPSR